MTVLAGIVLHYVVFVVYKCVHRLCSLCVVSCCCFACLSCVSLCYAGCAKIRSLVRVLIINVVWVMYFWVALCSVLVILVGLCPVSALFCVAVFARYQSILFDFVLWVLRVLCYCCVGHMFLCCRVGVFKMCSSVY